MHKKTGITITLLAVLVLLFGSYKISKSRTFQFFGGITNRVITNKKVVALTFDDGPTSYTEEVLQILDRLSVKTTFFVTGQELVKNFELGKQIVDEGHELGNHSYTHSRMVLKSYSFIKNEIDDTNRAIHRAGYQEQIFFRPPNCKKFILLPYYLRSIDMKTVTWDLEPDSIKEIMHDPQKMYEYVIEKVKPGSIILMHVMYKSRNASREALPLIVNGLRKQGYEFVLLRDLIKN